MFGVKREIRRRLKLSAIVLLVSAMLPIGALGAEVSATDKSVYGYVYTDSVNKLTSSAGDEAVREYQKIKSVNANVSGATAPPVCDVLGLVGRKKTYRAGGLSNIYEASEYCLYNILLGRFSVTFTTVKALSDSELKTALYDCVTMYFPYNLEYAYQARGSSYDVEFKIDTVRLAYERNFAAANINSIISGAFTERDKVKSINDWLVRHTVVAGANDVNNIEGYGQGAKNAFDGMAQSAGYANAFALLCYYAGINAACVNGSAENSNRWNIILCTDKKKRLADAAQNDPDDPDNPNKVNYNSLWLTDLTAGTASGDSKAAKRSWDKSIDAFMAYINSSEVLKADVYSGNINASRSGMTLWLGGGNTATPSGGVLTTNTVQLAAYEGYGLSGSVMYYDYAKAKTRAWAVTLSSNTKPVMNGANYDSDNTVISMSGGKINAVAPGVAYVWFIGKDQTGMWFDAMTKPVKVTVKVGAGTVCLSTNDVYDPMSGITTTPKPLIDAPLKVGNSLRLYLNAFYKKGNDALTVPDTTYTISLDKPSDVQYVGFAVTGRVGVVDSIMVNASALGRARTVVIRAIDCEYKDVKGVSTPNPVKVSISAKCNETGATAKFTVTVDL